MRQAVGCAAAALCAAAAGVGGGMLAASHTRAPLPPSAAAAPSAMQVHEQTSDLCGSWVTAYLSLPTPQTATVDVLPPASFIADALTRNPAADPTVVDVVTRDLRMLQDQAAVLSHVQPAGAIQPPATFSGKAADAADAAAWHICYSYRE